MNAVALMGRLLVQS